MPPAARGALFEKTAPLDPLQKLLNGRMNMYMKNFACLLSFFPFPFFLLQAVGEIPGIDRQKQGDWRLFKKA